MFFRQHRKYLLFILWYNKNKEGYNREHDAWDWKNNKSKNTFKLELIL